MKELEKQQLKEKKEHRRAEHLCVSCGSPLPEGDTHINCPECRETLSLRAKKRRAEKRKVRVLAESQNVLGAEALTKMNTLEAKFDLITALLKHNNTIK